MIYVWNTKVYKLVRTYWDYQDGTKSTRARHMGHNRPKPEQGITFSPPSLRPSAVYHFHGSETQDLLSVPRDTCPLHEPTCMQWEYWLWIPRFKICLQPSTSCGTSPHTHITSLKLSSSLRVKELTRRWYDWNTKDHKLARTYLYYQGGIIGPKTRTLISWGITLTPKYN